ncbi:MAG: DUF58 domain-containing protein [Acidimicrobiales bacterium]
MSPTAAPVAPGTSILSTEELTSLGRLQLLFHRPHRGDNPGERRSPRTGSSPEFADFRSYSTGDDLRRIDWKAFARFDRLILRLDVAEEEVALNIVLDVSDSMTFGSPAKWLAARRLAAALTLVGLNEADRVAVGVLRKGGPYTPHLRRGGGAGRALSFLSGLEPGGSAGPEDLASLRWLRPGMTVVISDFLVEEPWSGPLAGLRSARHEPVLWQILAPEEEHPDLDGDFVLHDVESAAEMELTVTPKLVREYLDALAEHRQGLIQQVSGAQGRFLNTLSNANLHATVLAGLRAGVLRRS